IPPAWRRGTPGEPHHPPPGGYGSVRRARRRLYHPGAAAGRRGQKRGRAAILPVTRKGAAMTAIGRPCKLTDETQGIICAALAKGATFRLACHAAGLSYETFRRW